MLKIIRRRELRILAGNKISGFSTDNEGPLGTLFKNKDGKGSGGFTPVHDGPLASDLVDFI